MFVQTVLVSLFLILVGLGLCFAGYRFFRVLVPIWGLLAGFEFGATIFTNLFGEGFLRTVISWVIGLLIGIFAAVLAYRFYVAAVIVLSGFLGYILGIAVMDWIGVKPGFFPFLVGVVVGVVFGVLALRQDWAKINIIFLTAVGGAILILSGFFLAFGRISLDGLQSGGLGAILHDSWLWVILYIALVGVGYSAQSATTQGDITLAPYDATSYDTTSAPVADAPDANASAGSVSPADA